MAVVRRRLVAAPKQIPSLFRTWPRLGGTWRLNPSSITYPLPTSSTSGRSDFSLKRFDENGVVGGSNGTELADLTRTTGFGV